jgi:hypothetical protein
VQLTVELVRGDITEVEAPVAVVGRYKDLPPSGLVQELDCRLGFWLSHAIELGMIGSDLGELFYIPITRKQIAPSAVILAGMGEPGRFGGDELSYLMTNVAFAIQALGHDRFATVLIGERGGALSRNRAVRSLLEGVIDGLQRFPEPGELALHLILVERDDASFQTIGTILDALSRDPDDLGATLQIVKKELPVTEAACATEQPRPEEPPYEPMTRVTITCVPPLESAAVGAPGSPTQAAGTAVSSLFGPSRPVVPLVLQYSALSETAVISVRNVEVQSYFAAALPKRLMASAEAEEQEAFGKLLASYLIPEDFHKLIEDNALTLVLDATTAGYPWEMAAFEGRRGTSYFGIERKLARQFRTLLSAAPGIPPPLNRSLRVLVIADPAPAPLHLPGAQAEGLAVVGVLKSAREAWGEQLDLQATVRIGAYANSDQAELRRLLDGLVDGQVVVSAKPCDPLELLTLLVNESYDVVHYAGHGIFEPENRRMGWVFDAACTLSAQEIFRVPQVPRLVFANACHSAEVSAESQRRQGVGLAEAFFARGIQNYIGTGWAVDDAQAQAFAVLFYRQVLGLKGAPGGVKVIGTSPPATLGAALAAARRAIRDRGSSWGAYQHYGQSNAKLLAFPNRDAATEG